MPSVLSADEIIEIAAGRLAQGMVPEDLGPLSIDTRSGVEGAWFVALKGKTYDGHDFLGDAFTGGALGCIVEERHSYPLPSTNFPLIAVSDTLVALKDLARNWRRRLATKVIFVIGAEIARSQALVQCIAKLISSRFVCKAIDASASSEAFFELVSLEEESAFVAVSFDPPGLDDVEFLASAFCPNIVCLIDEPFGYMRIAAESEQLKAAATAVISSMDRRPGLILSACSDSPCLPDLSGVERHAVRLYRGSSSNQQMQGPSSASSECFMPTAEESWCIAEVCKNCGIPDDIIYGAFV